MRRSPGFPLIKVLLLFVLTVGLIGGSYLVWPRNKARPASYNPSAMNLGYASPAVTTPSAPAITSSDGLSQAMSAVNQTDVSGSNVDNTQLGIQAAGF